MRLSLSTIKDITSGAVKIEQMEDGIRFYRFTKTQEELYKNRNESFYNKTFATSGVQMRFRTDSQTVFLSVEIASGSTRNYFSFEVYVNGKRTGVLNNFAEEDLSGDYTKSAFLLGTFSKEFSLGAGEKEVLICFPWSVRVTLLDLVIDDGSFIVPIKPSKKLLCFGDSITHGYDALFPSSKYTARLAAMLDAEEYNKAIGGEVFFPALAATKEEFEPDYITVAYGTNDWGKFTKEAFSENCKGFLDNLTHNYPDTKTVVITPIWRKDMNESKVFGDFLCLDECIRKTAACYKNVSVINGFDFVPQAVSLFADLRLHPNDSGFAYYFESLKNRIKDIFQK